VQNPSGIRCKLYTVMSRASQDLFALRHELVRYATARGIRAAMRRFGCARNTVRLWLRRWQAGEDSFQNHSRRPRHQPARTPPVVEQAVVTARKKAPCFGARRLVDMFVPPVGKGAAHRIFRDHQPVRPRQRRRTPPLQPTRQARRQRRCRKLPRHHRSRVLRPRILPPPPALPGLRHHLSALLQLRPQKPLPP
jgi:hypothetical protein